MKRAVITVAGKGGVGKTSICAAIVRQLVASFPEARILAIDADPAVGLATALGVEVGMTVDDIRKTITEAGQGDSTKRKAIELLGEARFRLLDAMIETRGFAFIAVGRPEAAGCYCSVNAYLREVIGSLAEEFDYVVIDGEAGIEQINRRVMDEKYDLMSHPGIRLTPDGGAAAYDHTLAPRAKDDVILDPNRADDYAILDADDILYSNYEKGE